MNNNIYKTLGILFQPSDQLQDGTVEIDIGKYYDNNAVRVIRAWVLVTYQDVTAGAPVEIADGFAQIQNTTIMQLPPAQITVAGGLGIALSMNTTVIPENNEHNFLGDNVLESPNFEILMRGYKRSPGGYPPLFRFAFRCNVQLEFNFDDLNEQL